MKIIMVEKFFYRIQDSDDESVICRHFNTDRSNIIRNNKNIPLYAGEWVKIGVNNFKSHFVAPAENLDVIAKKYNISKEKLIADNNLTCKKLYIGQRIKIYK